MPFLCLPIQCTPSYYKTLQNTTENSEFMLNIVEYCINTWFKSYALIYIYSLYLYCSFILLLFIFYHLYLTSTVRPLYPLYLTSIRHLLYPPLFDLYSTFTVPPLLDLYFTSIHLLPPLFDLYSTFTVPLYLTSNQPSLYPSIWPLINLHCTPSIWPLFDLHCTPCT